MFSAGRSSALGVAVLAGGGFQCGSYCLGDCNLVTPPLEHPKHPKCWVWIQGALFQEEILRFGNGSRRGKETDGFESVLSEN